jgi:hydrogenase-4 component E
MERAMTGWTDLLFILVLVLDLFVLASSRLRAGIRAVAAQGGLLALLPVVLAGDATETRHVVVLALGALAVKGVGVPWLLARATRESKVTREVAPLLGFAPTMVLGALGIVAAVWFSAGLALPVPGKHLLLVPTSIGTVWCGLLLIVTRRKAVGQVLGFLVLENGVFVLGLLLSDFMPAMVEVGVLLDLFAAVFVMGLVMFDIQRAFSSLDTEKLAALKD